MKASRKDEAFIVLGMIVIKCFNFFSVVIFIDLI